MIIDVVADAVASGKAGAAAGSAAALTALKSAAEHVLVQHARWGQKEFFLFMGAPGKKLGDADQYEVGSGGADVPPVGNEAGTECAESEAGSASLESG